MNRRLFLKGMAGILAAGSAPFVVQSGILMPVRKIEVPPDIDFHGFMVGDNLYTSEFALSNYPDWLAYARTVGNVVLVHDPRDKNSA